MPCSYSWVLTGKLSLEFTCLTYKTRHVLQTVNSGNTAFRVYVTIGVIKKGLCWGEILRKLD